MWFGEEWGVGGDGDPAVDIACAYTSKYESSRQDRKLVMGLRFSHFQGSQAWRLVAWDVDFTSDCVKEPVNHPRISCLTRCGCRQIELSVALISFAPRVTLLVMVIDAKHSLETLDIKMYSLILGHLAIWLALHAPWGPWHIFLLMHDISVVK